MADPRVCVDCDQGVAFIIGFVFQSLKVTFGLFGLALLVTALVRTPPPLVVRPPRAHLARALSLPSSSCLRGQLTTRTLQIGWRKYPNRGIWSRMKKEKEKEEAWRRRRRPGDHHSARQQTWVQGNGIHPLSRFDCLTAPVLLNRLLERTTCRLGTDGKVSNLDRERSGSQVIEERGYTMVQATTRKGLTQ